MLHLHYIRLSTVQPLHYPPRSISVFIDTDTDHFLLAVFVSQNIITFKTNHMTNTGHLYQIYYCQYNKIKI